jgi:hypothetical protein
VIKAGIKYIHLHHAGLAIQALNGGISITNAFILHPQHTPLVFTHPSNMTFVSNDPGWWPMLDSELFYSYLIGLSYQSVMS